MLESTLLKHVYCLGLETVSRCQGPPSQATPVCSSSRYYLFVHLDFMEFNDAIRKSSPRPACLLQVWGCINDVPFITVRIQQRRTERSGSSLSPMRATWWRWKINWAPLVFSWIQSLQSESYIFCFKRCFCGKETFECECSLVYQTHGCSEGAGWHKEQVGDHPARHGGWNPTAQSRVGDVVQKLYITNTSNTVML